MVTEHRYKNDMEDTKNYSYILFPLPILQEVFKDPQNGIRYIFDFGIYRASQTLKVDGTNALKQALYCYYRGGLTLHLNGRFETLIAKGVFHPDTSYNGFDTTGKEFKAEEEISELAGYAKNDQDFYREVVEFHRLRQIKEVLRLRFSIESVIDTYWTYYNAYNGFRNEPLVSLKTSLLLDYTGNKSEFEKAVFAMYAGIKSLIGEKEFVATTREMMVCRMFGAKNKKALEPILKNKKMKAAHSKYSKRYQFEKALDYLLAAKFLAAKIGIKRRTYLSCQLDYGSLAQKIEEHIREKSLNYIIKQHRMNELEAKNSIKQHLYK